MTIDRYNSQTLQHYREKAAEVAQLREEIDKSVHLAGDLKQAQDLLEALHVKTKELGDVRKDLGAEGVFLATYGYEKINDHTVLFALPKGCSRIDICIEAERLVAARDKVPLFERECLSKWRDLPHFTYTISCSEVFCIDGRVDGGDNLDRAAHEWFLSARGLEFAKEGDLAVAFVLHMVATGESLFGTRTYIRNLEGSLFFCYEQGLFNGRVFDYIKSSVGVSARLPLNKYTIHG
jgi:hypothetical protein